MSQTHQLTTTPAPGERVLRFVGDTFRLHLAVVAQPSPDKRFKAFLRTDIGRRARGGERTTTRSGDSHLVSNGRWRDILMQPDGDGWSISLVLAEVGYFEVTCFIMDDLGFQHWVAERNLGICVHPDFARAGNSIYCAFTRLLGNNKDRKRAPFKSLKPAVEDLEKHGFTVIPPSGTLRDLKGQLPHIFKTLRCRWLHLLPVNPTPTTFARMGEHGSPYASLDLTAVDPALIEFDRLTTGVGQFVELTRETHRLGGRVMLDLVINHTGWGSWLHENHPEWFVKQEDRFASPGAWGTTWEDLVELDTKHQGLWGHLSEAFITWCRRGVDGFRCDAGYKVPVEVWRHVTGKVREEFPDTIFLLEGLGGGWLETERLLTEGGMQWAYSELFQEFNGREVSGYLDHAQKQSARIGTLVHYSETHDNERLAAKGRSWSLLRNQLCALASVNGAYGFTCGVEWLAGEKIRVHGTTGLAWGNPDNIIPEIARLNEILSGHPCFLDGVRLHRISPDGSVVYALLRESRDGRRHVLLLANTGINKCHALEIQPVEHPKQREALLSILNSVNAVNLLSRPLPRMETQSRGQGIITLEPAEVCLLEAGCPGEEGGDEDYLVARARAAWAVQMLAHELEPESMGDVDWSRLAAMVDYDPSAFLASIALVAESSGDNLVSRLEIAGRESRFPRVTVWELLSANRLTPVPYGHWLLLRLPQQFRAVVEDSTGLCAFAKSIPASATHVVAFPPGEPGMGRIQLESYDEEVRIHEAEFRRLPSVDDELIPVAGPDEWRKSGKWPVVLLTNGRGGMTHLCVNLGTVQSKYDCVLGANLDAAIPVDRHVLVKRIRVWANAGGFIIPLNGDNLLGFRQEGRGAWLFDAFAGDQCSVGVAMTMEMPQGRNTVYFNFRKIQGDTDLTGLPNDWSQHTDRWENIEGIPLKLTIRLDLEDRNFHQETSLTPDAERHFIKHTAILPREPGFSFEPCQDRHLTARATEGNFHSEPECCRGIAHPVESTRGQPCSGDAFSPGWFDITLE